MTWSICAPYWQYMCVCERVSIKSCEYKKLRIKISFIVFDDFDFIVVRFGCTSPVCLSVCLLCLENENIQSFLYTCKHIYTYMDFPTHTQTIFLCACVMSVFVLGVNIFSVINNSGKNSAIFFFFCLGGFSFFLYLFCPMISKYRALAMSQK